MFESRKKRKLNEFINVLQKSVDVFNDNVNKEYEIQSNIIKNCNAQSKKIKNRLYFEVHLTNENSEMVSILNKHIEVPHYIDVENMKIEKLNFNVEQMKKSFNNLNKYGLINSENRILRHKTIFAQFNNVIIQGGYETDYIYPTVSQNNVNSKISDDELNEYIKNYNRMDNMKLKLNAKNDGIDVETIIH